MGAWARVGGALLLWSVALAAQPGDLARARQIPYADVQPLWEMLRPHLPPELAAAAGPDAEATWDQWVAAHDARIRARVARGEEDTLVNLWLFGTSFTELPAARPREVAARGGATLSEVVEARLDDLVEALASPGTNERVRFAGSVLRAAGIDPATRDGRARARDYLSDLRTRMVAEHAGYERTLRAADENADPAAGILTNASLYRERGLSSDTSILSSFAIDSSLEVLRDAGAFGGTPVRRVAIVGPGLDVINKADGHDFYPEQTIQPFALIDSLLRLGLARAGDLTVTTFDVSSRVNEHLSGARRHAADGAGYVLHLTLGDADEWKPGVVRYWEHAGGSIGAAERPPTAKAPLHVRVRGVLVRPDVVLAIVPRDLNVVLERVELPEADRFDLVVATNVFAYYDILEQALAVVNVGRMLRPGGSLLSNQAVPALPPMKPVVGREIVAYSDRQFDHVFWYQRQ